MIAFYHVQFTFFLSIWKQAADANKDEGMLNWNSSEFPSNFILLLSSEFLVHITAEKDDEAQPDTISKNQDTVVKVTRPQGR